MLLNAQTKGSEHSISAPSKFKLSYFMGFAVSADLLGYSAPGSAGQGGPETDAELRVARSWAGLTSQGRILISIEQLASGQDVGLLMSHETVHDVLIHSSVLGMQQLALSAFGLAPWPEYPLTEMIRRILGSTVRASARVQEGCATFMPSVGLTGTDLDHYVASLSAEYKDMLKPIAWLRGRDLPDAAARDLAFAVGRFSLGVRFPPGLLTNPAAVAQFLKDPDHNPNKRFDAALAALATADDAELGRLSEASAPEAEIAQRWYAKSQGHPAQYTPNPATGRPWVTFWRELVAEMVTAWASDGRLGDADRRELREAAGHPEMLLQPQSPSVLKAVLLPTVALHEKVADHPPMVTLSPYELALISHNGFPTPIPGIETTDGTGGLMLAPEEAAVWLASSSGHDAAVRLSDAELRAYLSSASQDTTICLYDGDYVFPLADVLAAQPLVRGRRHLVLVANRSLGGFLYDAVLSQGLAGQTALKYAIVGSDIPGVSYFLAAPKDKPNPVVIVPAPTPSTARAHQELRDKSDAELTWTEVEMDEFFASVSGLGLIDLVRVFSWFEGRPLPPRTEQEGEADSVDFGLGPAPDSRGRGGDALAVLRPDVRRQLDEAGGFEAAGNPRRAADGYSKMMDSPDPQTKAAGSIALGIMLSHSMAPAAAVRAYLPAITSSDPDLAPLALLYSGQAYRAIGDLREALRAFQAAVLSRHPDHAPPAAYSLADAGDVIGMDSAFQEELLQWIVDSQHPDVWPLAGIKLARIWLSDRRSDAAVQLLRRVLASGHRGATRQAKQLLAEAGG